MKRKRNYTVAFELQVVENVEIGELVENFGVDETTSLKYINTNPTQGMRVIQLTVNNIVAVENNLLNTLTQLKY